MKISSESAENQTHTVKTTCPYCGVGCGVNVEVNQTSRQLSVKGDTSHPANFGRLCSKGSALGETVGLQERLLNPIIDGQTSTWEDALDRVAKTFKETIAQFGPDSVAIYGSGQLLTEDYYVANKLMKGFIGSANMDTNSRLCMSSSVAGHKRAFGSDTVPGCYEDLELAEMIVIIGSNTAWCHPVSFQRIKAAKNNNPSLKIVVIDPRKTNTCEIADLHLPLASGSDAVLFNGLLHFLYNHNFLNTGYIEDHTEGFESSLASAKPASLQQVSQDCQLPETDIALFFSWFAKHDKVMSLYSQGINQSASGTDKVNTIINCHLATGKIGKPGMGPFSLTGQPNAMGGREVGGLAHQLAAHMDFEKPVDVDRVARFWGSSKIANKAGLPAVDLFDAVYDGKVKAIWIMGTNPVVSMPNADKVKQALQKCPFVVVSDCIAKTDTTVLAHVLLPAQGWSEKNGTVTNSERRISRQRPLFNPSGEAKPDWWIISQVAMRLGFATAFNYANPADIFREHAALSGFENNMEVGLRDFDISGLAKINNSQYDNLLPTQWPINQQYPDGCARLFADGHFFTPSGKARFIAVQPRKPTHLPNSDLPLALNTGRLRDQWHTMTRTALAPKLNQHKPECFIEIHPQDAQKYGVLHDNLAEISNGWGSMLARVQVTENQTAGSIFVPMHWSEQFANRARVGALVNPDVDPFSKQPELKHTPVAIKPYEVAWYGFILTRLELSITKEDYWVVNKGSAFNRYELAGKKLPNDWEVWLRKLIKSDTNAENTWQTYQDDGLGRYRSAHIINDRLETIVFVSAQNTLPERSWLTSLFSKDLLDPTERKALLTGRPPIGVADVGAIVCSCFSVGEKTLQDAIVKQGLKTTREVSQCLKAGSNCGSCLPEIKTILLTQSASTSINVS